MRWFAFVSAVLLLMAPRGAGATLDVPAQCDDDRDCAPYPENPWCDLSGSCYRCSEDTDCTGLDEVCTGGACVLPCVDAMDCTAAEPTCHPADGICVECVDNGDCLESEYCSVGLCVPDGCAQGETRCASFSPSVAICNVDGSGWEVVETCDVDCMLVDGVAQCTAEETTSGGSSSGDASTGATTTGVNTTTGETGISEDASSETGDPESSSGATDEGCGCRAGSDAAGFGWLLLVLLGHRRRDDADTDAAA